jgi:signal peptidase I
MVRLLKVSGNSLTPDYRDGDFVLVSKIPYLFYEIKQGDIIAFRHKEYGTMIKKVEDVAPSVGEIHVIGTHENSVDSRRFGPITSDDMLGKVIWHVKKPL